MKPSSLSLEEIASQIKSEKLRIIGVSGVPGAGKTTIAEKLQHLIPDSIRLSMDGFHIYRKDLNEEGIKRRGAPFTFDYHKFK